jgi:hypothetical protein
VDNGEISRRRFVIESCTSLGSAWVLAHMPEILLAQEHAHQAATSQNPTKLEYLSPQVAAEVEAIAAQIIPTDDTPGAKEARVIYFIDRALASFASSDKPEFEKGLTELQKKVRKRFKKDSFSALTSDQQVRMLKSIDRSPFFEMIRTLTVLGMFSNPSYGGNHQEIGWKLIGFESKFYFQPPFGFYDREHSNNS